MWAVVAAVAVLAVVVLGYVTVVRPIDRAMDEWDPERSVGPRDPDVTTTLPPLDPEDAALYDEVRCRLRGSSTVDPGVAIEGTGPSAQRMQLLPGAEFDCVSAEGRTTGSISMTTEMPEMTAFHGEGTATGVIDWSTVGPGISEASGRTSHLTAEVELAYPNVILLFTIQDGPYHGYRGSVVLGKWSFRTDAAGRIVQVDFEPTDLVLSDS